MRGLARLGAAKAEKEAKQQGRLAGAKGGLQEGGEEGNEARATPSHTRNSTGTAKRGLVQQQEGAEGGKEAGVSRAGRQKKMARRRLAPERASESAAAPLSSDGGARD